MLNLYTVFQSGWRGFQGLTRPLCTLCIAFSMAFMLSACSLFSGFYDGDEPLATGSIGPIQTQKPSLTRLELSDEDWRRASGAMAIALDPVGNGQSVSWENPETGAAGTFAPVSVALAGPNGVCRAFIASVHTRGGMESWHQGQSCKKDDGTWSVLSSEPWKKPS
jgi:surface antigen